MVHENENRPAVPTIVWCHPRSCSTAFERAFLQRADTKVWHEPMGDAFYFSKDRACRRYDEAQCRSNTAYDSTVESIVFKLLESTREPHDPPYKFVFIKDMAQYIFSASALNALHPDSQLFRPGKPYDPAQLTNPTVLPTALLRRFKHTFLIRKPEDSVPSYYKCASEKAMGFEFFDPAEVGYVELKILYDWLSNPQSSFHTDPDDERYAAWPIQPIQSRPPVVDADMLLDHPGYVVSEYCEAIGVPFDAQMLSWNPGAVDIWAKWGSYHAAAQESSGFVRSVEEKDMSKMPEIVLRCIQYVSCTHTLTTSQRKQAHLRLLVQSTHHSFAINKRIYDLS